MVKFKKQIVSDSVINKRSYGRGNPVDYVIIHQTGNTNKGADAQAHANIQTNLNPRQASWHESVDDKQAVQSFPDDVKCWAAGDGHGSGNTRGYQIEICINSDGDYEQAVKNGAERARIKLKEHGLGIGRLKQHADFANKNCPEQLRGNHDGISWNDFVKMVEGVKVESAPKQKVKSHTVIKNNKNNKSDNIAKFQKWLNSYSFNNIKVDGLYGSASEKAATKAYQYELNKQFGSNLVVDGIWGAKTHAATKTIKKGATGNITRIIQGVLYGKGYNPNGFDGIFGGGTETAIERFQSDEGIGVDGKPGKNTFAKLLG